MLFFGYLGETRTIPVLLGVFLGFIPFLIYYYIIYVNYVTQNTSGYLLFWYLFAFNHNLIINLSVALYHLDSNFIFRTLLAFIKIRLIRQTQQFIYNLLIIGQDL